ncbi:electron transport protein SCO1/SenC [Marinobacter lipolyticus SM19]|uniref:Electron transport protein SCO1/SenC n=1 Tax=Marinobacter lipolyticus SM19 TaxID=1318628 RepID=R8AZB8_9GAMM|nr:SCO family protein [Marinobacter lipolyticus]EON91652.1 electron transport protein SCO1/SenC [Marinobacter lipolyticus SM19]
MNSHFPANFRSWLNLPLILIATIVLSGCLGEDSSWHGKDIQGLMPELAFELTGTSGETVTASDLDGQIRLLFFGFTSCPDVCPTTLQKLSQAIKAMPPELQSQTQTLFVSVDPQRDTPERLARYVDFFDKRIVGLTGNEPELRELAKRYRTTFGYDEPDADGNYAVSHSSAVYVFDRDGKARLLLRPDLSTDEIRQDLIALARENS